MNKIRCPVCSRILTHKIYEPCCSLNCSMRYEPPREQLVREPELQDALTALVVAATLFGEPPALPSQEARRDD